MTVQTAHYLSVDPGKASGWATFAEDGLLLDSGVASAKELPDLLKSVRPKVIIYETFRLRPWMAQQQSWSEFPAAQIIGALELFANMTGAKFIGQEPSAKEIGYKWSGTPKARSHKNSHDKDAYAHGVHFMIKNKVRKPTSYLNKAVE